MRQCEADLVDHVFGGQDADDEQRGALEQAVCALAPRVTAVSLHLSVHSSTHSSPLELVYLQ